MEINHKFDFVEGAFNAKEGKIICVTSDKYAETKLCFKANMHIPFAKIKLYTKDLFVDAQETNEDAYRLGNEICKRWNISGEMSIGLKYLLDKLYILEHTDNGVRSDLMIDVMKMKDKLNELINTL